MSSPRFLVIGAGSRGHAYARAVKRATSGTIAVVAEPDAFKREEFGKSHIKDWDQRYPRSGHEFGDWQSWVDWETARRIQASLPTKNETSSKAKVVIDGVFICSLDDTHADIIRALAPLNLHILCEKPLALSLQDCLSISRVLRPTPNHPPEKVISIGHVLRYSPHNQLLRKLVLQDQVIGEIASIEHTEPVGWWHFSHSYVRGNWRRATPEGVGSLLTKSCHDIDFILWLLCSPPDATSYAPPHLPSAISSTGALTHFRKAQKPKKAGAATNCLSCAAEPGCNYSALKIYRDRWLRETKDTGWPLKIVMPEIEDIVSKSDWDTAEAQLIKTLKEDYDHRKVSDSHIAQRSWYGRCVYESDNDVADEQVVTMAWEDDQLPSLELGRGRKTAVFHMTYATQAQCERRGRIYGTLGEITYDSKTINVYTFADEQVERHEIPEQDAEVEKSHGGGDFGLTKAFVTAVQAVENGEMSVDEAQRRYVGCDLDEVIRSHAVVFAAEEARMKKVVVDFPAWWAEKVRENTILP